MRRIKKRNKREKKKKTGNKKKEEEYNKGEQIKIKKKIKKS